jgi:uncharacterized membrane protein YdjX (TVP38/TMEM64 family)
LKRQRITRVLKWAAVAAVAAAALWLLGREAGGWVTAFADWVEGLGALGPLGFVAGYAIATVALIPGSVLTLAAGALFGILWGTLLALTGATLGATAAFLVSRHLARERVERRLGRDPRVERIGRAIGREGLRIVVLLRLSPALPFVLLNYALGLTRVTLRHYLLASLGMLPGTLLYVYNGRLIGEIAMLGSGAAPPRGPGYYLVLLLGLLATLAVTVWVTRLARRALEEETDEPAVTRTD